MSDIQLGSHTKKGKNSVNTIDLDPSSFAARGNRLIRIRKLMGLTREDFHEKYGISSGTLRGWEEARLTGLSEKNVTRLMPVLEGENIQCSIGWLLHGEGSSPLVLDKAAKKNSSEQKTALAEEIDVFCKHHLQAVYIQVADDGMEPYYYEGDYVAGERLYQKDMHTAIGQHCIVETQQGEVLLCTLRAGTEKNKYTLQCVNLDPKLRNPILYNVELLSAAPVIWYRRIINNVF
jgi:transcriptional regulator with XRE-family HTH domain